MRDQAPRRANASVAGLGDRGEALIELAGPWLAGMARSLGGSATKGNVPHLGAAELAGEREDLVEVGASSRTRDWF